MRSRLLAIGWTIVGMLIAMIAITVSISAYETHVVSTRTNDLVKVIREDQKRGIARSKQTAENILIARDTLDLLESCTIPGGECYERGRQRGEDLATSINQTTIIINYCAENYGTLRLVETCVRDLLASRAERP